MKYAIKNVCLNILFFNEMVFHNLALDSLHFIKFHTVMYLTGLLWKIDHW